MIYKTSLLALIFLLPALALSQENQADLFSSESPFPRVLELNWLNDQFLIKQRKRVDDMTRRHFGQQLKNGKANMPLLQRLIDEEIIGKGETLELQALGVVLGDIFVDSHKNLSWRVYEDEEGKSHAVCVDDSEHCLFPVTMLSRRIEVGSKPDVEGIFTKSMSIIQPMLPRLPYSS